VDGGPKKSPVEIRKTSARNRERVTGLPYSGGLKKQGVCCKGLERALRGQSNGCSKREEGDLLRLKGSDSSPTKRHHVRGPLRKNGQGERVPIMRKKDLGYRREMGWVLHCPKNISMADKNAGSENFISRGLGADKERSMKGSAFHDTQWRKLTTPRLVNTLVIGGVGWSQLHGTHAKRLPAEWGEGGWVEGA